MYESYLPKCSQRWISRSRCCADTRILSAPRVKVMECSLPIADDPVKSETYESEEKCVLDGSNLRECLPCLKM